jgi:hypothetical protein
VVAEGREGASCSSSPGQTDSDKHSSFFSYLYMTLRCLVLYPPSATLRSLARCSYAGGSQIFREVSNQIGAIENSHGHRKIWDRHGAMTDLFREVEPGQPSLKTLM